MTVIPHPASHTVAVDDELISALESALESAKSGRVIGYFLVTLDRDKTMKWGAEWDHQQSSRSEIAGIGFRGLTGFAS